MRSLVLTVCFGFFISTSQAQFTDSTTHHIRISASGNINRSNNSTAYLINNDARFSIHNKQRTLNTVAAWLYGEQGARLTNNDFISTTDLNLYPDSSKLYYWALANYTTSLSLRIKHQLQTGGGIAYNIINTTNAWLNLSDGIIYEISRLSTGKPDFDHYNTFRNSFRLSYKFNIQKSVVFSGR